MNGSIPIFHNSLNIFLNHFCKLVCWKIRFYSAFLFLIIILVKAANVTFLNVYSLSKTCKKKFLFLTFILVAHVKVLSKKRKKTCYLIKNSNSMSVALTHFSILMRHFWNQIDKSTLFIFCVISFFMFFWKNLFVELFSFRIF